MAVSVSTVQNPTSFQNFSTTLVKPFFKGTGEGPVCIPIDLDTTGVSGVVDGANVTLQFQFDGGDGNLFQASFYAVAVIPNWLLKMVLTPKVCGLDAVDKCDNSCERYLYKQHFRFVF